MALHQAEQAILGALKGKMGADEVAKKADGRATLNRVVGIWDMCRKRGVSQVSIATGE